MISLELWRARIGTFNNKRCSGCSLSSLSSSSLDSAHFRRHRGSTHVSQEESPSLAQPLTSPSSLATKEQSQAFSSTISHSVLATSRTSQSVSFSKSSSCFIPTPGVSLCRSLLRAVITLLIAVISQLLMIAGDIETNPGPKHGGEVHVDLPSVYKFDSV